MLKEPYNNKKSNVKRDPAGGDKSLKLTKPRFFINNLFWKVTKFF